MEKILLLILRSLTKRSLQLERPYIKPSPQKATKIHLEKIRKIAIHKITKIAITKKKTIKIIKKCLTSVIAVITIFFYFNEVILVIIIFHKMGSRNNQLEENITISVKYAAIIGVFVLGLIGYVAYR